MRVRIAAVSDAPLGLHYVSLHLLGSPYAARLLAASPDSWQILRLDHRITLE